MVKQILPLLQIISAVILIILVLVQQRGGTALGSAFGGGGGFYLTQRGVQKKIYWLTIIVASLFVAFALLNILL